MSKGTQHLNQKQKDQNQLSLIEAELATLERFNSEMTSNYEKLKREKDKSDMKFKQFRDHMVMKICQDSTNFEDLESLIRLEPVELMAKFENVLSTKNSETIDISLEEKETVADLKSKLNIQLQQRDIYEKQHNKMMDLLDLPKENRCFKAGERRVLCVYPVQGRIWHGLYHMDAHQWGFSRLQNQGCRFLQHAEISPQAARIFT